MILELTWSVNIHLSLALTKDYCHIFLPWHDLQPEQQQQTVFTSDTKNFLYTNSVYWTEDSVLNLIIVSVLRNIIESVLQSMRCGMEALKHTRNYTCMSNKLRS